MKQIQPFGDDRILSSCVYCGAAPTSRDHVPPRIFLDDPFPENLPVVPSCGKCNRSFSIDEEYCAALIDCAIVGTARPTERHRAKVRRILESRPAISAALEAICKRGDAADEIVRGPDQPRVDNVCLKLARGHAAFELHEIEVDEPSSLFISVLRGIDAVKRKAFESPPPVRLLPEVGSRAMLRMFEHGVSSASWIVIQQGRYRFLASPGPPLLVRVVVGEYLACEVVWGGA